MSKNTYNILLLYHLYSSYIFTLFFQFSRLNYKILFKTKKFRPFSRNIKFNLNNYYFFNNNWCIFYFSIFFLIPFSQKSKDFFSKKIFFQNKFKSLNV